MSKDGAVSHSRRGFTGLLLMAVLGVVIVNAAVDALFPHWNFWQAQSVTLILAVLVAAVAAYFSQQQQQKSNERTLLALNEDQVLNAKLYELMAANVQDYAILMLDPQGYVKTWNP